MGWMKKGLLIGGVASALLVGCGSNQQTKNATASGSLALSNDDSMLYAADSDNGVVSVIDTKANTKAYEVPVGSRPMKLAVGGDDTLYVANRGSRSVSVIRKGERQVSAELSTGVDPTGMAVSFDGKTLYVVSATAKDNNEYGLIQAFDTATLEEKYAQPLGYEPRSIALVSNEKALVTEFKGSDKGADVIEVDLRTGTTMNGGSTGLYERANFTKTDPSADKSLTFASFKSRGQTDVVVTPNGDRAFVTTVWAREDDISRQPSPTGGYYAAGGPCNLGAVATAGIVTMNTSANGATEAKVDDLTDCASRGTSGTGEADFPPTAMGTGGVNNFGGGNSVAVQGPSAAAVDPTGEWLFVVNKETSNVAVMPAWRRQGRDGEPINYDATGTSFRSVVAVNTKEAALNSGADGIALTKDGRTAFVYNQFDHNVVRMGNPEGGPMSQVRVTDTIDLALKDTLPADAVKGRRFFFDASSEKMSSNQTHVSCGTCHLEGRDDGHVWGFPGVNTPGMTGKRQTPTLIGRKIAETKPLHWTGEFNDFNEFMNHTVIKRMGGSGDAVVTAQIESFVESAALPENPNAHTNLSEAQLRGQAVFMQAECGTCHTGQYLTDQKMEAVDRQPSFDTPSLRGISRSAPYMHDGRVKNLRERVFAGGNDHGKLAGLSHDQQEDLLEYLKSL